MTRRRVLTPSSPVAADPGAASAGSRPAAAPRSGAAPTPWWLAAVAVAFGVLQVALLGRRIGYGNDEIIYLSILNPAVPAYDWEAHRAVGTALLVAPVSVWDAPIEVVRGYLVVVSSLGLFAAFLPWLRVRDSLAAPVAASLFGFSYVVVWQAGLILPNYYTALAAVAATGLFVRRCHGDRSRNVLVGLAAAVGAAVLLRPTDGLWLVLPLVVMWLVRRPWRRLGTGLAIGAGLAVGWGYWLVETWLWFPGPAERLQEASRAVDGGLEVSLSTVELYVRMWSQGRMECFKTGGIPCVVTEPIQPVAFAWLIAAAGLGLWGLATCLRRRPAADAVVPVLVGLSLAFPYFVLLRYGAIRFLFPSAAVLAVPVAYGVLSALRARWSYLRPVAAALTVVVVLGQLPMHRSSVEKFTSDALGSSSYQHVLAERLRGMGIAPPCGVVANVGSGFIYALRCKALGIDQEIEYPTQEPALLADARAEGQSVAVVLNDAPPDGSYLDHWRRLSSEPSGRGYLVFLPPGQAVATPD